MVGSSDAEAKVIEATDQRKGTGRKRVKTRDEMDKHNARCVESRKKKKRRFEELEELESEVVPKLQDENKKMKIERDDLTSKMQGLEDENKQLREQVANLEEIMRQIPTSWEFDGQKFSSLEHCQDWILSQNYDLQVSQGSNYNITASDAGPGPSFIANPDFTTLLGANLFSYDLAANNITGILGNPDAGSFVANHDLSVSDADASNHDNTGLFTHDPAGFLSNPGAGFSAANHDLPVFDADNTGLFTYHPANGSLF